MAGPRVVVIGAGVVGAALADELALRGWDQITVVDQGPLPAAGGSSSHAPGLVFQANSSRTMTQLATYTVDKLCALSSADGPAFLQVGGLEVATTPERAAELHRRARLAAGRGRTGPRSSTRPRPCAGIRCSTRSWCWAASTRPPTASPKRCAGSTPSCPGPGRTGCACSTGTRCSTSSSRGDRVVGVRYRPGRDCCRHRRVLRGDLGTEGRGHGRHDAAAHPVGPPAGLDVSGADRGRDRARGGAADPASPGPGPLLPGAFRPYRHRLLRPPADADPRRGHPERRRRRGHAVGAGVHPGGFRGGLEADPGAVAPHPRRVGGRGHQRAVLLHHRQHAADG